MIEDILKRAIQNVRKKGAESRYAPKKAMVIEEKTVVAPKPPEAKEGEPTEEKGDMGEMLEAVRKSIMEPEAKEGEETWSHSEDSEPKEAEQIEKDADLHRKPSWEAFEDEDPNWLSDPEKVKALIEKIAKR